MQAKYKVNIIYNDKGIMFNDLINALFSSFLDKGLELFQSNNVTMENKE